MTEGHNTYNSNYYLQLFKKHGISHKSLGWDKGKQFLRFDQLTKFWRLQDCSILDVGCGFGDFVYYLKSKDTWTSIHYLGIDLIDKFVQVAKKSHDENNIEFISGDFLDATFKKDFDYVISSGVFNLKNNLEDNYKIIQIYIAKMLLHCNKSVSIDFLSDQVDFKHNHNFYWNPSRVLNIACNFSRNVSLSHDYFPFEFTLTINKDDSFDKKTTIFKNFYE